MVYLFLVPWLLLGLGIFLSAISGGPRGVRENLLHAQSKLGRRLVGGLIALTFLGAGVVVPTLVIANNKNNDHAGRARVKLTKDEEHGREVFGHRCQQCHTLAAADAVGRTGPNLDQLKPKYGLVYDAVLHGRARGNGTMPAQIVNGDDARDVAKFVAKVAGTQ
jgi:mono/diheme cytochrome c family protein